MNEHEINKLLLEISPTGILTLNAKGEITYANKEAEKILGLSKSELSQLYYNAPEWKITDFEGNPFPNEKLPFFQVMNSHKSVFKVQHAIEWQSGKRIYLSINAAPIHNDQEEVDGVIVTIEDISARINAEKELKRSRKQYVDLFNNLIDEIHVWELIKNEKGEILNWKLADVNPAALKSWGKTKEDVIGKDAIELFGKEAIHRFLPIVKGIFEKQEPHRWETYFPPTRQHLMMDSIPLGDYFISTGRDITDVKKNQTELTHAKEEAEKAKEEAIKSENQLKQAQSIAKLGGWEFDFLTGLFSFNDNFYEIFRSSVDRVGGYQMTAQEYANRFVHPEDRDVVGREIEKAVKTTDPNFSHALEHRMLYDNGEVGYINVKYFVVKDQHGKTIKLYGVNQDISEKKLVEKEVIKAKNRAEQSERELLEAQELSHVGSWEYFLETDLVNWSRELFNIFERSFDLPAPKWSEQRPFYTPKSFEKLEKAVEKCVKQGIPYELELEIYTSSGKIKHIISKGGVKKNAANQVIGCYGTAQDITDRKKLEIDLLSAKERAEENEARYRGLISSLETGIVVHAQDTSILLCNERSSQLLGLSKDQMLGKVAMDPQWQFIQEDSAPVPLEDYPVMRVLNTKQPIRNQVLGVFRPQQDIVWLMVNGFPVKNEKGELIEIVISFIDITSLRVSELKLEKQNEQLKAIAWHQSHKVRAPLATLMGLATVIQVEKDTQEAKMLLNKMNPIFYELDEIIHETVRKTEQIW